MATKTITQTEFFPGVEPAAIYDAMLSGPKHTKMTGSKATGSAQVGGTFTAWDGYISGKNVELDPDKKIVQEWTTTEWPRDAPPSIVTWTFKADKGGTEVTLVHSNVPAEQADSYKGGWNDYYFEPMKEYFAK
jgi:activator of HSP90 ATPase